MMEDGKEAEPLHDKDEGHGGALSMTFHYLKLPIETAFHYTIPECCAFPLSCFWILIISYVLVQLTKLIGKSL